MSYYAAVGELSSSHRWSARSDQGPTPLEAVAATAADDAVAASGTHGEPGRPVGQAVGGIVASHYHPGTHDQRPLAEAPEDEGLARRFAGTVQVLLGGRIRELEQRPVLVVRPAQWQGSFTSTRSPYFE